MKRITILLMCITFTMITSCISMYVSEVTPKSYYGDGIYYVPGKEDRPSSGRHDDRYREMDDDDDDDEYDDDDFDDDDFDDDDDDRHISRSGRGHNKGYWKGGWYGSDDDLRKAYSIIRKYPNGFGYIIDDNEVMVNMAFSEEWNVYIAGDRFWWFPSPANKTFYSSFVINAYPSINLVLFDYTPYKRIYHYSGRGFSISIYDDWDFYDDWMFYDSWRWSYRDRYVWNHYYNPFYWDPYWDPLWDPYWGPHWGCHMHHHGWYDPYWGCYPNHIRPPKPGRPERPQPRPGDDKWKETSTSGGTIIRPGTVQGTAVGGGVTTGGSSSRVPSGTSNKVVRPTLDPPSRNENASRPGTNGGSTITRPGSRPSGSGESYVPIRNSDTKITRPSNGGSATPSRNGSSHNSRDRYTRPQNIQRPSDISRPSSSGSSRGGSSISRPAPERPSGISRPGAVSGPSGISRPSSGGSSRGGSGGGPAVRPGSIQRPY